MWCRMNDERGGKKISLFNFRGRDHESRTTARLGLLRLEAVVAAVRNNRHAGVTGGENRCRKRASDKRQPA